MSSPKNLHEIEQNHFKRTSAGGKVPRREISPYLYDDPTNPRLPFQEQDALSEASATTIADEDMSAGALFKPQESSAGHIVLSGGQKASAGSARGSAATANRLQAAPSSTAHQSEHGEDLLEELMPENGLPFKRIVRCEMTVAGLRYFVESISSSGRTCGWVEADSLRNDHKVIAEFYIENGHAEGWGWAILALWGTKWGHILAFVGAHGL